MSRTVDLKTPAGHIGGTCDARFQGVLDAFHQNFLERDEVGASVALTLEGKTVVDLWGGRRERNGADWTRDTVCTVFSSTKGLMSLCAHLLVDGGLLDLDAPIARYWPDFAAGGKESARVSMTLDHTVGVPHVRAPVPAGGFWDYDYMVGRVAEEEAFWTPGTCQGYHGITMAWTVGELIRRTSGVRLRDFFRSELAGPLGAEAWIGLPQALEPQVAPMIPATPDNEWVNTRFVQAALTAEGSPANLFMRDFMLFDANSRECHAAEVGSANGIANGRALARCYAPFANGGALEGKRYIGVEALSRMGRVSAATQDDATLMIPVRFGLGFMKAVDNRRLPGIVNSSLLMSDAAFGHVGAGGSIGFADPTTRMSFGYAMNRMGTGLLVNDRGQSLIDAAYTALGFRSNASGVWEQ